MKISRRIYRLLLRVYPREHRRQYGELMVTHFCDQLRAAPSRAARLRLWGRTLLDVAQSAPREHMDGAWEQPVTPWPVVLLAILPGAIPFLFPYGSPMTKGAILLSLVAVYLCLVVLFVKKERPVAWAFAVLGLGGGYVTMALLFMLAGERAPYGQLMAIVTVLGALAIAPSWIRGGGRRTTLLGVAAAANLAAVLAWHGARNVWLHGLGLETAVIMLPAVALGTVLARRYGVLSGLLVAGSAYLAIELSIDPSVLIRFGSWSAILGIGSFFLTFSMVPLLALRARSTGRRTWALLAPLALTLLALLFLPPLVYSIATGATVSAMGMAPQIGARALHGAQIFTMMAFALSLYHDLAGQGASHTFGQRGHATQINEAA